MLSFVNRSERNGGRPNDWVSTWRIWLWLRARFSAEVVLTGPLDAKRKFIFGLHPHGILPIAGMMNFQSPER